MAGAQAFNVEILFRADIQSAKAGMAEIKRELGEIGPAATTAASGAEGAAEAIGRQGTAATGAASGLSAAARAADAFRAANSTAVPSVNTLTIAMQAQETAMQRAVAGFAGISTATESGTASGLRHGMMLDDLRARYNPLFAASRQYEMVLRDIAEAERLGAISATEAMVARQRAAQAMLAPTSSRSGQAGGMGATGSYAANLSFQMNDVFMMTAMGQDPMMLMLQQGPQVAQIFGQMKAAGVSMGTALAGAFRMMLTPWGLFAMAAIGGGAALVQWMMDAGEEAKTFEEHLDDLEATMSRMKGSLDRLSNIRLDETFGNLTGDVRALSKGLLDLDRAAELKSLNAVVDGFLKKEVNPSWWQVLTTSQGSRWQVETGAIPEVDFRADNYADLGAANTYEDFITRKDKIADLAKGGDIEGVTRELVELHRAMSGGGALTEMGDELRKLLTELAEAGIKTAEIEALWNGTGQEKARTRQTDQIVTAYRQEAELQAASLSFGEDSVEVEQIRARHARELLDVRLAEMGVLAGTENHTRAIAALEERQAAIAAAAAEARKERIRDQADELAGIQRQIALIGASNAERIRANALAEADIEIRKRKLKGQEAEEEKAGAIARAEAEIAREHQQAMRDIFVASTLDVFDARIAKERDPILRAAIEAEKAYAQVLLETGDAERAAAEASRVRVRALREVETERRKALEDIALAGAMDQYDARIAAARDPHVRIAIEAEKEYASVLAETRDAQQAAASAERVRARGLADLAQEQADYLRAGQESIAQLQLELALLGQSEVTRARVLALAQAERDIQRLGLTGAAAEEVRRRATEEAALTAEIEKQADAWDRVQQAGEGAIDAVLDKLKAGDMKGAFSDLIGEIEGMFFDLAVRNPLKNLIMGTNLGTWEDVGGWGGIWDRLTGKAKIDEAATVARAIQQVQQMTVTAASVTIAGPGAQMFMSSMGGGMGTAAGGGVLPGGAAVSIPGLPFTAASIAKLDGVDTRLIEILALAEKMSGIDIEVTEGLRSRERQAELFAAGKSQTMNSKHLTGSAADIMVMGPDGKGTWDYAQYAAFAPYAKQAAAQLGYADQFTWGGDWKSFKDGVHFQMNDAPKQTFSAGSVPIIPPATTAALEKFGATTKDATAGLGTLGTGFDLFGNALGNAAQGFASGGLQGGLVGLLGSLAPAIAGAMGIPGFATGGDHRGGWRIVGENGPELEATGAARIYNAAETREILTSRAPAVVANSTAAPAASPMRLTVNNYTGQEVQTEETTDAQGGRQLTMTIGEHVSAAVAQRGNPARRAMDGAWQPRNRVVRR